MLVDVPFARTQDLEPRGIDDQVDRAVVGASQRLHLDDLIPAGESGVVRGLEVEAYPAEQRVEETLGLAKREAENGPQCQRGQDAEVRVPPLAAAETILRWCPRSDRLRAQPIVTSPRLLRARSYSRQFRILYLVLYLRSTRLDFRAATTSPPRSP